METVKTDTDICTVCKNCYWAIYDGDTQTGCALGRIEQFEKNGVEIIEAEDGDTEFFIIPEKICFAYRDEEWAKKNINDLVNLFDKLELEMAVKIDVVVYVNKESDIEALTRTLDSLKRQLFPPNAVRIILDNNMSLSMLVALLQQNYKELNWSIDHTNPENTIEDNINISVKNCKGFFVTFLNSNHSLGWSSLNSINDYINKQLKQFVMIVPTQNPADCFSGYVVQRQLFNMFGGNSSKNFVEKIKEVAEETQMEHMIINWENLDGE